MPGMLLYEGLPKPMIRGAPHRAQQALTLLNAVTLLIISMQVLQDRAHDGNLS